MMWWLVLIWVLWLIVGHYNIDIDWTDTEVILFYTLQKRRYHKVLFRF